MRDFATASPDIARLVWWRMGGFRCAFCGCPLNNSEDANRQMKVNATSVSACLCGGKGDPRKSRAA